jgi:hypothetical protein
MVKPMERKDLFKFSRQNAEWLQENYDNLKRDYNNSWVVIENRKVIKSASSFDEILIAIKKSDSNKILVEYIQAEPVAMFF